MRDSDAHKVEITHRDKLYFPDDKITKGEFVDYIEQIASTMLPHVSGRPVTMHRFPDGIKKQGFIQKEAPDYFPSWFRRMELPTLEDEGTITMAVIEHEADLVYLANLGVITEHVWLSRVDRPDKPDKLVFDIDPDGIDFAQVRSVARMIRGLLEDELGLVSFVMTTGSMGLHVVVPLAPAEGFDEVRSFAQNAATVLVHRSQDLLTTEQRKESRGGRIYIDAMRNSYAQTSVAPYSVRALPGAPVAAPLKWEQLDDADLTPQTFSIRNMLDHLSKTRDPWKDMWKQACSLDEARDVLDSLCAEIAVGGDFAGQTT